MGYAIDGLSDAEALGHLDIIRKVLEERQSRRFLDQDEEDGAFIKAFHVDCPECGESLCFAPEDLYEGAEFEDDEDEEE